MEKKFKLGVIGAGFMSRAIVEGAISSGFLNCSSILVSDVSATALDYLSKKGVEVTTDNAKIFSEAEFILFAVKPQVFESVAKITSSDYSYKIISIMAGVKKDRIKSFYPEAEIARCMPNTPCSVGYGAVGMDVSSFKENSDADFIINLFSSFAKVVVLDEIMLNTVTGISGSAPAYFYLFLKGIIDAAVKRGLNENDARILACNTMIGSGLMVLKNSDKCLEELIDAVCSKGGTTIEAVKVFNEHNIGDITDAAVNACINRAAELENL